MTKKDFKIVLAASLVCAAMGAQAQIRPAYFYPGATPATGGTRLGESPVFFSPWVGLAAGYDDNMFLTNGGEKTSALYIVSPGFKLDARSPNSVIQLSHQHQVGRYTSSHADDYVDHVTRAQADMAFSGRMFGRIGLDYVKSHDPRGSTDRAISPRPDEYQLWSPNATFAFGAPGAQGRAELYYSYGQKRYENNRATTLLSDRDTQEYGGALYVRVAPKTYALVEARQTDIDYTAGGAFSGEERRYYGGVAWEATAATTGTLKVGQLRRKFNSGLPPAKATSWEGLISWAPRTYSRFDFYTSRQTSESTGLGRFILTEVAGVNWNHEWSSVWLTGVNLRYQRDQYQGFNRTDDTKSLGLRVGYKMRRWLVLGAEYTFATRDSNLNFDYDKNFYLLTATIAP
jgi:polysaccharide biosynthesis protein VpsM